METLTERIAELHASNTMVYSACTGAGAGLQDLITQVPGSSATLIESIFPYSKESLVAFLGEMPKQFASVETAMKMADCAWKRGTDLRKGIKEDRRNIVGLGVSAVIATNRPLKGEHRVFIAARTEQKLFSVAVRFAKDSSGLSVLGRKEEGRICDLLALNMLLYCAGIEQVSFSSKALTSQEFVAVGNNCKLIPQVKESVCDGAIAPNTVFFPDGQVANSNVLNPEKHILFPGSFNPLHAGHIKMAEEVKNKTGKDVVFAITCKHPDKGTVDTGDLEDRVKQFRWKGTVLAMEDLPLYVDKAKAFPGFSFIIGADTLRRLLDPKYYPVSIEVMLQVFEDCQTTFFVADRQDKDSLVTLDELMKNIPNKFHGMFTQLSTVIHVSSTAIRQGGR